MGFVAICATGQLAQAGDAAAQRLDCQALPCARVLPRATRFERVAEQPYVVGKDATGKTVGWVALSSDVVEIKGYSGKPLVTLVAITPEAKIAGALIVQHSEPILLVGIPEQKLTDFVAFYREVIDHLDRRRGLARSERRHRRCDLWGDGYRVGGKPHDPRHRSPGW